jgi:hypothetical protein
VDEPHDPLAIEHERRGHGVDGVALSNLFFGVPHDGEFHRCPGDEGRDELCLVVLGDPDDVDLSAVAVGELLEPGERLEAWAALGCPEVDHDHVAGVLDARLARAWHGGALRFGGVAPDQRVLRVPVAGLRRWACGAGRER